jgi:predicted permease
MLSDGPKSGKDIALRLSVVLPCIILSYLATAVLLGGGVDSGTLAFSIIIAIVIGIGIGLMWWKRSKGESS